MSDFQIPLFPISEKTKWEELPDIVGQTVDSCERNLNGYCPPLLIYEPVTPSRFPHIKVEVSEAPEELLVIAAEPVTREAVFQALGRVEAREPQSDQKKPVNIKFKHNTPLRSIFRQMGDIPITVFSLTVPDDEGGGYTFFFLRTAFTISEFRRESQKPIE